MLRGGGTCSLGVVLRNTVLATPIICFFGSRVRYWLATTSCGLSPSLAACWGEGDRFGDFTRNAADARRASFLLMVSIVSFFTLYAKSTEGDRCSGISRGLIALKQLLGFDHCLRLDLNAFSSARYRCIAADCALLLEKRAFLAGAAVSNAGWLGESSLASRWTCSPSVAIR